ncbi:MAG: hypothetical protein Alpg2KO_25560 [Alphaproteobacteria bacterium]
MMIKAVHIFTLALSLAFTAPALAQSGQADFVPGLDDVPLMTALSQQGGYDLVFDKPEGRIVESVVTGDVQALSVKAFYDQNLPQLGWKSAGQDRWLREGEVLQLQYFSTETQTLGVRFTLKPAQ